MQRLSENAMWLREDNLSVKNEIVIPYDSELALWDRPSWIDSLLRLRWCCPALESPSPPKVIEVEAKGEDSNHSYRSRTRSKKSRKKGGKQQKQQYPHHQSAFDERPSRAHAAYQHPRNGIPLPPPSTPEQQHYQQCNHQQQPSHSHNGRYDDGNYYANSSHYYQQHQAYNGYPHHTPMVFVQPQLHHHHHNNQVLAANSVHYTNPPGYISRHKHLALSSLSSVGSDFFAAIGAPATEDRGEPKQDSKNQKNADLLDGISPAAAAAGNAAAVTLKKDGKKKETEKRKKKETDKEVEVKEAEKKDDAVIKDGETKLQQRLTSTATLLKNPKLPPLIHRGISISQPQQPEGTVTPSSSFGGVKPPLAQRSSSVSPSAAALTILQPSSPFSDRPRLHSDASKRSVGTGSTRHRRTSHGTFEFSASSLKYIVNHDLPPPPISPPKYIECRRQSSYTVVEWPTLHLRQDEEDDANSTKFSVDEEIGHLVSRAKAYSSNPVEFVFPADSSDDNNRGHVSNSNAPALSWLNSWAAQGDDAAGNPPTKEDKLHQGRSRNNKSGSATKEKFPTALHGKSTTKFKDVTNINVERPVYLPRCGAFDRPLRKAKNRVIISGWAAISLSDKLRNLLAVMEGPLQLKRSDIAYFQLFQQADRSKRPVLRIKRDDKDHDIQLKDRYEYQFQSQEVCGRAGRCVCLVDVFSREVLVTILPVSLPKFFFRDSKLVDEKYFSTMQMALFTPFTTVRPRPSGREHTERGPEYFIHRYAPDEQYDAATHVLFASDSALEVKRLTFVPTDFVL
ncbi:hypothetical protein ACA910_005098 [Epithemia clementina (nom. ined.)]